MTEELIRDFKGVWIQKEILLDDRLNTIDKIILMEIDSLDATEEGCYASNKYLSEFCKCTETTISTSISKLVKLGYLEIIKFDGRKRYIKSSLSNFEKQTLKNLKADFKNFKDINIVNNIDDNKYNIYGEFNNVKLTNEQYEKLKEKNLLSYIESLSCYLENHPRKKYASHYATILNWSRRYKEVYTIDTPKWFDKKVSNENITLQEENEIENILKEIGE